MAGGKMKSLLKPFSSERTPLLSPFIAEEEWDAVRKLLTKNTGRKGKLGDLGSALRMACAFRPPLDVVQSIVSLHPGAATEIDALGGQCPLHIAVECAASSPVIEYLVDQHPAAAGLQDISGKTPLHFACESYAKNYVHCPSETDCRTFDKEILGVIKCLCNAAPSCVNLEDVDGMTALEYAIEESGVTVRGVKFIQKACEKDWKARRAPGVGHEAAQKSILEQSRPHSAVQFCEKLKVAEIVLSQPAKALEKKGLKGQIMKRTAVPTKPKKRNWSRALTA